MKTLWMIVLISIVCVGTVAFSSRADNTSVKGDYVEVRTASVFAGACHYNGEVTTTGRDALMAWNVTSGNFCGRQSLKCASCSPRRTDRKQVCNP